MSLSLINNALLAGARHETGRKNWGFLDVNKKPSRSLKTDKFVPPPTLSTATDGSCFVPTYADLVRGLEFLPQGVDARALTQCVSWWLNHQSLDLNVLHTAELFRMLRTPLRPVGPMNLDRVMLAEWQEKKNLSDVKVTDCQVIKDEERELNVPKVAYNTVLQAPLFALMRLEVEALKGVLNRREDECTGT
jgi:hypothetical protein